MKKEIQDIIDDVNDSLLHQELKDGIIERLQDQRVEIELGKIETIEVDLEEAIEDGYITCDSDACIAYLNLNGFTNVDSKAATRFLRMEFKQNGSNIHYGIRTQDDFVLK